MLRRYLLLLFYFLAFVFYLGAFHVANYSSSALMVVSRTPAVNQLIAAVDTKVDVTFSENIDNTTVNRGTFCVYGSFSGNISGDFSVTGAIATFNPASDFKVGEVVTVTLTQGIKSAQGSNLSSSLTWQFIIKVPDGPSVFLPGANFGTGNDFTMSVALGDVNNDGHLDIVVANTNQQNEIYINDGSDTYSTGIDLGKDISDTRSIALGDVNGDGSLDIVVGNYGGQNVVYLGNGKGTIWTPINFGTGCDATLSVALGDVNGDGALDIVVGNAGGQNVVYLGNGKGTDWTPINFGTGSDATCSVALGDVNGDSHLDIVVGNAGQQNVVYLNDGSGITWNGVDFGASIMNTCSVALGDVNGDGALDIVVGNILHQNLVYKNDGTGIDWTPVDFGTGGNNTRSVALGDVNGDGSLDIVVGNYGGQNVVYLSNGKGTDWTPINFGTGSDLTYSVALGDMNNDGDLDIVVGNNDQQNLVYMNLGSEIRVEGNSNEIVSGDITPNTIDFTDFGSMVVDNGTVCRTFIISNIGDFTLILSDQPVSLSGDNSTDFCVISQPSGPISAGDNTTFTVKFDPSVSGLRTAKVNIVNNDSNENPYTFAIQGTGLGPLTVLSRNPAVNQLNVMADSNISVTFSDDVDNETVFASTFSIYGSLSGRIAGNYSTNGDTITFNPFHYFKVGETVTVTLTKGIQSTFGRTLYGSLTWQFLVKVPNGSITFNPEVPFGTDVDNTDSIVLGDVDNNSSLDIVVGHLVQPNVVYRNNGTGTGWMGVNNLDGVYGTRSVALGDLEGDGDLDVIIGNDNQQNVVYKNDGTGTSWIPISFGTGSDQTYSIALGDVNGDGTLDIVEGNVGGQNVVYTNDGTDTNWIPISFLGTGSDTTYSIALGDVNGDGTLDIVEGNFNGQNVIYLNDGTCTNWTQINFGTGRDKTLSVALGDVNGDGHLDIGVGNDGQNVVYINDGTGTNWIPISFGTGSDKTYSIALGDVNGDGHLDIGVGNEGSQNVVYLNNGKGTIWTPINFGTGSDETWSLAFGDMDNDGDLDIVVGNVLQPSLVYKNTGPEIKVEGNSYEIISGDITPTVIDCTDFGYTPVENGVIYRNFLIKNTGDAALILSGTDNVKLSGDNSSGFSIISQPSTSISADDSTPFTVRFDPTVIGLNTSTISIANNDSNENPYTFKIQGWGTVPLTVTGLTADDKVYDGKTTATLNGTLFLSGLIHDYENVTLDGIAIGSFPDKQVGIDKAVTITGLKINGADAANYVFTQPSGLTASITAKSLTVSGLLAQDKEYDNNTTAVLSGTPVLSGLIEGDDVTINGTPLGTFTDQQVGTDKPVIVTGLTISGNDTANYVFTQPSGLTADINKKPLTVTGITAKGKSFDRTTFAKISTSNALLTGVITGDDVMLDVSSAVGYFDDALVGNSKIVRISGLTLNGTDATNYNLIQPTTTANITTGGGDGGGGGGSISLPTITSTTPAKDTIEVNIDSPIKATFSTEMNPNTINTNNFFLMKGQKQIAGTVNYNTVNKTATFTPSQILDYKTLYTVTIKKQITNTSGLGLAGDVIWNFTTRPAPLFQVQLIGFSGGKLELDNDGNVNSSVILTSDGGDITLKIDAGTKMRNSEGKPLEKLIVSRNPSPPGANNGYEVLRAFELGLEGFDFSPYLTMIINYKLVTSQDFDEKELKICYWSMSQWEDLDAKLDSQAGTATISVSHFNTYALIGKVYTPPTPTPTLTPTPTPIPTPTPTPVPSADHIKITFDGQTKEYELNSEMKLAETVSLNSKDQKISITILAGTLIRDRDIETPPSLTVSSSESLYQKIEDNATQIGPQVSVDLDGIFVSLPVKFTWKLSTDDKTKITDNNKLQLLVFNQNNKKWDIANNSVTFDNQNASIDISVMGTYCLVVQNSVQKDKTNWWIIIIIILIILFGIAVIMKIIRRKRQPTVKLPPTHQGTNPEQLNSQTST
jgi:predicted nucleotidyltransferase